MLGYSEVNEAFETAARYDDEVLAEEFIEGPELTVAILGGGAAALALPVIEIRAPGGNYDFENKYNTNDTQYLCPAPLAANVTDAVQALAVAAYRAIGCEGWGRVDLMLRARDSQPFLLEVNTSPGMTDHSLVPMAARAAGIPFAQLVLRLLEGVGHG